MRTGHLIEKLITISDSSKTDFALHMNMSPSGLSKVLTGTRLPPQKEKKIFYQQAAAYFTKALWEPHCYAKFEEIFPILYDFNSAQELDQFLSQAIQYALDIEYAAENNKNLDFSSWEECYLGARSSLNMLCIFLSDQILSGSGDPLELYINLPLFVNASPDLLDRLIFTGLSHKYGLCFHYFINASYMSSENSIMGYPFLDTALKTQKFGDLVFWTADWKNKHPFVLLKGRLLLVFSTLMDGTQTMTVITHKSFIASFFASLMKHGSRRISFSGAEALAVFREKPDFVNELINKNIKAVYSFSSLGFLLRDEDVDVSPKLEHPKREMIKLFEHILQSSPRLYITKDIVEHFYITGKLVVPLVGIIDIPQSKRLPYLARLSAYINSRAAGSVIILHAAMPRLAVLQSSESTILYLTNSQFGYEKFHVLQTGAVQRGLTKELASDRFNPLPLSEEMWNTLLQELRSK